MRSRRGDKCLLIIRIFVLVGTLSPGLRYILSGLLSGLVSAPSHLSGHGSPILAMFGFCWHAHSMWYRSPCSWQCLHVALYWSGLISLLMLALGNV